MVAERVAARNQLESFVYQVKNQINESEEVLQASEKEFVLEKVESVVEWMNKSHEASKEEYTEKQKEFTDSVQEYMGKLNQGSNNGGNPFEQFQSSSDNKGPVVEEID